MRTSIRGIWGAAFTLVLATTAGIALGSDVTIQVQVFDRDTGGGIPGARVQWYTANVDISDPRYKGEGSTSLSGVYSFTPGFGSGYKYCISVGARGYATPNPQVVTPGPGLFQSSFSLTPVDGTPVVDAGIDRVFPVSAVPFTVTDFIVRVTDLDEYVRSYAWTFLGDGGMVDFYKGSTAVGNTTRDHSYTFYFPDFGVYHLRFDYQDEWGDFGSDTVTVTVQGLTVVNRPPVAEAGGPYTGLVGQSMTLDGSGSTDADGDVLTYEWDLDNDGQYDDATGVTVPHTWHAPFSGVVDLRVTDTYGLTDTATATVTISATPTGGGCEPLVYLSLDETAGTVAHDLSGHGYDGTLKGGARTGPQWVAGHEGGALTFDGRDDYVDTGVTQNLAQWTICCWVSSPAAPSSEAPCGPIHRSQNYHLNWNHGDPKFRSTAALSVGGTWYAASFGTLAADTWYHLAATYDGTALKAYRDGELITTTSCPGTPAAESDSLKLARHAGQAQCFAGTIDEVYVYPCALSQAEIQALMNKGVMTVREVIDNGPIRDQQACYDSLNSGQGTLVEYTTDVLDRHDGGPRGHFGRDEPFGVVTRGDRTPGSVDDLSLRADGVLRIPARQEGDWTFGVNSDDGFTLLFPGRSFSSVINGELAPLTGGTALRFAGGRGVADTLGVIHLPAGDHPFWLTYHEGAGDASVEFFAAPGVHQLFDPDLFRLVGQRDIGAVGVPGLCAEGTMVATKPGSWSGGLIASLADARAALAEGQANRSTRSAAVLFVNHADPDLGEPNSGLFPADAAFPNGVTRKDDNDFAVKVTGLLDIPADGVYQIGFNSDDGASLRITGQVWQSIVADGTGAAVLAGDELINDAISGNTLTAGQIELTAGCHAFEAIMFERAGGSYFELLGRGVSDRGLPDPTWRLLRTAGARYPIDVTGLPLVQPSGAP